MTKKSQIPNLKCQIPNGFTLVEMLVVMAVLSVVSILILNIFTRTLRGGNKSQIIESIKQNGQSVLEIMDKTIRNSDRVVCPANKDNTIAVVKNGVYTKFKFVVPTSAANGYFQQATFNLPTSPPPGCTLPACDPNLYIKDFETTLCSVDTTGFQTITDTNSQTGVSVDCIATDCNTNPIFSRDKSAGFPDQVTIKFILNHAVLAAQSVAGQIDPVSFQTTIQIR